MILILMKKLRQRLLKKQKQKHIRGWEYSFGQSTRLECVRPLCLIPAAQNQYFYSQIKVSKWQGGDSTQSTYTTTVWYMASYPLFTHTP